MAKKHWTLSRKGTVPLSNVLRLYGVFMLLYCSGYYHMVTASSFSLWIMLPYVLLAGFQDLFYWRLRLPKYCGAFLLFCITSAGLSTIANYPAETLRSFFSMSMLFYAAYLVSQRMEWDEFRKIYLNTMLVISAISLIFYFSLVVFRIHLPFFYNLYINGEPYSSCYLYVYRTAYFFRNQGLFWEPGLFAAYLIFALILHFLYDEKLSIWKLALLVVTILTTQSTTGIVLLVVAALLLLMKRKTKKRKTIPFITILFGMGTYFFAVNQMGLHNSVVASGIQNVINKLTGNSINFIARQNSPLVNLSIFRKYPIFGAGYQNATNIYVNIRNSIAVVDAQTSTTTYHLAAVGIVGIVFSLILIVGIFKIEKFNFPSRLLLTLTAFVLINVEPYNGLLFYYVILFYLLKQSDNQKVRRCSA